MAEATRNKLGCLNPGRQGAGLATQAGGYFASCKVSPTCVEVQQRLTELRFHDIVELCWHNSTCPNFEYQLHQFTSVALQGPPQRQNTTVRRENSLGNYFSSRPLAPPSPIIKGIAKFDVGSPHIESLIFRTQKRLPQQHTAGHCTTSYKAFQTEHTAECPRN